MVNQYLGRGRLGGYDYGYGWISTSLCVNVYYVLSYYLAQAVAVAVAANRPPWPLHWPPSLMKRARVKGYHWLRVVRSAYTFPLFVIKDGGQCRLIIHHWVSSGGRLIHLQTPLHKLNAADMLRTGHAHVFYARNAANRPMFCLLLSHQWGRCLRVWRHLQGVYSDTAVKLAASKMSDGLKQLIILTHAPSDSNL